MQTLKDVVKSTAKQGSTSRKNPGYYTHKKNEFIEEMAFHPDAPVRLAVASSKCAPAQILSKMLKNEINPTVIKAILLNINLPMVAVKPYVTALPDDDPLHTDPDIIRHIYARKYGKETKEVEETETVEEMENLV